MTRAPQPTASALISAARADLCLEFANTRYWRGTDEPTETLNRMDDLTGWCAKEAYAPGEIDKLKAWWDAHADAAPTALAEVIALREALYRIFTAVAARESPAHADLALFNRVLEAAPARTQLVTQDGAYLWRVDGLNPTIPHLLTPVLWTAGDLLAEPRRDRVRRCGNEKCVWLFLDDSKSGTRRWCSMSSCGNRAKAHRHYERKKKEKKKR
jgi:predicted RNA-binding Zn ribbon-like protein